MTQNLAPGPATQLVGTTLTQAESGASYSAVTGTITTATSTVTTGNIGVAGNVTVYIYGTYAGVNATFEISPDNTNWFPVAMNREDLGWGETTTGVLPANTLRSWTMGAPGLLFFRVRATAFTSGTANVAILAGTYPFEPMVSNVARKDAGRNLTTYRNTAYATTATDALVSLTGFKGGVAVAATTTPPVVTTGKTLRIQTIDVGYFNATAVIASASWKLRVNTAGTVVIGSPIFYESWLGTNAATAGAITRQTIVIPDGMEIAAGSGIGLSAQGLNAAGSAAIAGWLTIQILGYEY